MGEFGVLTYLRNLHVQHLVVSTIYVISNKILFVFIHQLLIHQIISFIQLIITIILGIHSIIYLNNASALQN